jgi:flavin reductase (DIM6/NTAB) family NADH-FMN oxidoreductase RutF
MILAMNPKIRKQTLRLLTNGMYVITSRHGDSFGAATVTWVSQASFKPPLIMAAIRPDSNVFKCLSRSRVAAIHILDFTQQDIAAKFFAPTQAHDGTINGEPFTSGKTSAPILRNIPSYVEGRVLHIVETGGDHSLIVMEAVDAACGENVRPLTIGESPWEYGG